MRRFVRKISLFLLPWLLASCLLFPEQNEGVRDRRDLSPEVSHLKGKIYLVEDSNYWKTNSLFYASDGGILFIDSTWTDAGAHRIIYKAAARGRGEYLGLLLTDDRPFRTGGLLRFIQERIPVFTTVAIFNGINQKWETYQEKMRRDFSTWLPAPLPNLRGTMMVPDSFLEGKVQIIKVDDAFSPGNFMVFFPDEKILYGGSLLSVPLYFRERIRVDSYNAILNKVQELKPEIIVSGHGEAIQGDDFLERFVAELKRNYPEFNRL